MALLSFLSVLTMSGCSTAPYKDDIVKFKAGVDAATLVFEALEKRSLENDKMETAKEVATDLPKVHLGVKCTGHSADTGLANTTEVQIQADADCLRAWSDYKAQPAQSRGPSPSCPGASEVVRAGKDDFYDFGVLRQREAEACKLGVVRGNSLDVKAFDTEPTSPETIRLSAGLRAYATALSEIADSADREALAGSVAKAKTSLDTLAKNAAKARGKTVSNASLVGPVTELVGSFLGAALERRRLKALQTVTAAADGVVGLAAVLIANTSVGLTQIEITSAKRDFIRTVPAALDMKDEAEWLATYQAANAARDKYLAVYATSPIDALKAMAAAHEQLTIALADPKRQYEKVAEATIEFAEKAQALQAASEKLAEGKENEKKKAEGD